MIFDTLGIVEPSTTSRNQLVSWFNTAQANHPWSIQTDALVLGAMTPDFQVI